MTGRVHMLHLRIDALTREIDELEEQLLDLQEACEHKFLGGWCDNCGVHQSDAEERK